MENNLSLSGSILSNENIIEIEKIDNRENEIFELEREKKNKKFNFKKIKGLCRR